MKTQIIRLEPHDDINSARDKLTWAAGDRVLLVWPRRYTGITHQLDLVLLRRLCTAQGSQLGVVTTDHRVSENACLAGIPVFRNVERARRKSWRQGRQSQALPGSSKARPDLRQMKQGSASDKLSPAVNSLLRILLFCTAFLSILVLAGFFIPSARVQITLPVETQRVSMEISAVYGSSPNVLGVIPAYPRQVTVSSEAAKNSSGWVTVPDAAAIGEVIFTNLTGLAQTIPEGTVILTAGENPIRFFTTSLVQVPAGAASQTTASIRAVQPGKGGNVPAGGITAVEGSLGLQVMVENHAAVSGGTDRQVRAPAASDYQTLQDEIMDFLDQAAMQQFQDSLQPGEILIPESLFAGDDPELIFSPPAGQASDTADLGMKMQYQAYIFLSQDLQNVATAALDANLPAGKTALAGTLAVDSETRPVIVPGQATQFSWRLNASRKFSAVLDEAAVSSSVLRRSPAQAGQALADILPPASVIRIETEPAWWPLMPALPFRIDIQNLTLSHPGGSTG